MKIICDYCGKEYSNYQEALECEKKCKEKFEEKERWESEKKERLNSIIKEIESFNKEYDETYYIWKMSKYEKSRLKFF